jgi:hypothetical protein
MQIWSAWKAMPSPDLCKSIEGPLGPGVYQIRNKSTKQLIQFGIGVECQKRMRSLFPKPYGSGTRNNEEKRNYILKHWQTLEYRTLKTASREDAALIEKAIKQANNHLFNT